MAKAPRKTEIVLKFEGDCTGYRADVAGLALIEGADGATVSPVRLEILNTPEGLVFGVRWDGLPLGLKGERPNLDLLLQAYNARRT